VTLTYDLDLVTS